MSQLWGRSAKLTFGVPGEVGVLIDTKHSVDIPQITFNISKSIEDKNNAKIQVYNLNDANREIIQDTNKSKLKCAFEVGYGDENFSIFKGDIQHAYNVWDNGTWVTNIESVDGLPTQQKVFNKTYAAKTDFKKIMGDIVDGYSTEFKGLLKDIKSEVTQNGITLSGITDTVAKKVIAMLPNQNLEYTIQDGTAIIKSATSILEEGDIPLITNTSGLVGSPKKTEEGVEFTTLIQRGMYPGRAVKLESRFEENNGIYIIQKTKLKGSLRDRGYYAEVEAKATDKFEEVILE